MKTATLIPITALTAGLMNPFALRAIEYGGVEFEDGAVSFADVVADFYPAVVNGQPGSAFLNADAALGIPDLNGDAEVDYVSLGSGGSITLRFTDNSLNGSGNNALDLWIFEIGPDVEDTFVEISMNGSLWHSVGSVSGSTSGIDIDAFGFGPTDLFSFVRLTDDPSKDATSGITVGADIDAVGAISSAPPVATPDGGATLVLLGLGFGGLAFSKWRTAATPGRGE